MALEHVRGAETLPSPELSASLNLKYAIPSSLELNGDLTYSGPMLIPREVDPSNERREIKRSPTFFNLSLMVDYKLYNRKDWQVKMTASLQNIFNDYQQDFDFGPD